MGNRKAREWRRRMDHEASWERLRASPWHPDNPWRADGSGQPRVQIIRSPSFAPACFWEVCRLRDDWLLYRARVVTSWYPGPLAVQGYDPTPFPPEAMADYFRRLISLALPIAPDLSGMAGLDGTRTELTLFGDVDSCVRFQWWSEPPAGWSPLAEIADEMLAAFERAAPAG
jgi:hypothetical protein